MPLICDATALIALGAIESISLLEHADPLIIVSKWVAREEAAGFHVQIERGEADGWLNVRSPHQPTVAILMGSVETIRLDRGEAETIALALEFGSTPLILLVDEGATWGWLRDAEERQGKDRVWQVKCLARVLHELEGRRAISSASSLMRQMQDLGVYAWAPQVKRDYVKWCEQTGTSSVL